MQPVTVVAPKEAKMTAMISAGEPPSKIRWYKNTTELHSGPRYEMEYVNDEATLTIDRSEFDDAATYRCEAANRMGRVETEAALTVYGECHKRSDKSITVFHVSIIKQGKFP